MLWTLVLSLLVVLILEVVERPPSADAEADADADADPEAIDGVAPDDDVLEGAEGEKADLASANPLGRASS